MTDDTFRRDLDLWLREDAAYRVPDHLGDILRETAASRQRQWWSSLQGWLPMDTTFTGRLAPSTRPVWLVAATGLVLLAIVGALLLAGSGRRLPPPFGLAKAGLVALSRTGDIYTLDPATRRETLVVGGSDYDYSPQFSRDGTRLAFFRPMTNATVKVMVSNPDGTDLREVSTSLAPLVEGPGSMAWSGDGSSIAVRVLGQRIAVVDVVHGTSRIVDPGPIVEWVSWLPPLGEELVFRGDPDSGKSEVAVYAMRPDGTGLRALTSQDGEPGSSYQHPILSPDGRYLAYNSWTDEVAHHLFVRDLAAASTREIAAEGLFTDLYPAEFLPDGRTLLAMQTIRHGLCCPAGAMTQLVLLPIDGSTPGRPIGPAVEVHHAVGDDTLIGGVSPDGETAYALIGEGEGAREVTLWTLPIDGAPGTSEPWSGQESGWVFPSIQRVRP